MGTREEGLAAALEILDKLTDEEFKGFLKLLETKLTPVAEGQF